MPRFFFVFVLTIALHWATPFAHATDFIEDSRGNEGTDTSLDPFSDYSEFEEGSEEEADVNFFHNGRFFTIGGYGGAGLFTGSLGEIYKPGFSYGVFISYFFDLRFAVQGAYILDGHSIHLTGPDGSNIPGSVQLQHFEFDVKYYFNTQNVTRGLAKINPYAMGGVSEYFRTTTLVGQAGYVRDSEFGMQVGGGLEIPFMRNKMFFGGQGTVGYISFPDQGVPVTFNGNSTGATQGVMLNFLGFVGFNF